MNARSRGFPGAARYAAILFALGCAGASVFAAAEYGARNDVGYEVGGWGAEMTQALEQDARNYPVKLVFAWQGSGEYLADVLLTVRDDSGRRLLSLSDAGPIVLLKLVPGRYRIEAVRNGRAQRRTLEVGAHTHQQAVFYWPRDEGSAGVSRNGTGSMDCPPGARMSAPRKILAGLESGATS